VNNNDAFARALRLTPGGTQTLSKAPDRYVNGVYPKIITEGRGCMIKDVEGKWFIDYIAALGPIIFGYRDVFIDEAVKKQIDKGVLFSLPSTLEADCAEALGSLVDFPTMWKFTKTGSDACSMAVKIARAYTGRSNVIACGYHGWHDWYSVANDKKLGIPSEIKSLISKVKYNDLESFRAAFNHETACVIMEPEIFETPKPGFLEGVKKLCEENGALLILDETVTGFRYPGVLAQVHYGIRPDLTIVGKAAGNGYPVAAIGGRSAVMDICTNDFFFASTTFGGDCVGLAACLETIRTIQSALPSIVSNGKELQAWFNECFEGLVFCKGFPSRTMFDFPSVEHKALFWQECVKRGVMFGYSNFTMFSHGDPQVMPRVFEAIHKASFVVLNNWKNPSLRLEGATPKEVFRLLRN
jgi:glutamate-1-semialdehyde 2,1-aminomutase